MGRAGPRLIHVVASTDDGKIESKSEKIAVNDCKAPNFPLVRTGSNPYHAYTADFTVKNASNFPGASYLWDFGDGTPKVRAGSYVSHFYGDRIDGSKPYETFTVTVSHPSTSSVAHYAVVLHDNYYYLKKQGIIQPKVSANRELVPSGSKLVGTYTIRNLEAEGLVFDRAVTEFYYCDPDRRSSFLQFLPKEPNFPSGPGFPSGPAIPSVPNIPNAPGRSIVTPITPVITPSRTARSPTLPHLPTGGGITVQAKQLYNGFVTFEASGIPQDACAIGHHLSGRTNSGVKAYASVYFELRSNHLRAQQVTDAKLNELLVTLIQQGLVQDETQITEEELYRLEQEGKIRRTERGWEVRNENR